MSTVSYIQEQLSSCIRRIFRSTELLPDIDEEAAEIIGESLTDPYSFGLIAEVMGRSLTDFSESEAPEITPFTSDVTWIDLDDLDDDESETTSLASIDKGIGFKDFNRLETDLENGTTDTSTLEVVSKLKGTALYDRLKENTESRSKISALLEKVDNGLCGESSLLYDMSDFLDTNIV